MANQNDAVIALVSKHAGIPLTPWQQKITAETNINSDLGLFQEEAEELMNDFFYNFNVNKNKFHIDIYLQNAAGVFRKRESRAIPYLKVIMLIESAKAGSWLY